MKNCIGCTQVFDAWRTQKYCEDNCRKRHKAKLREEARQIDEVRALRLLLCGQRNSAELIHHHAINATTILMLKDSGHIAWQDWGWDITNSGVEALIAYETKEETNRIHILEHPSNRCLRCGISPRDEEIAGGDRAYALGDTWLCCNWTYRITMPEGDEQ